MNERQIFDNAVTALLADPRLSDIHETVAALQARLIDDATPMTTLAQEGGLPFRLLSAQCAGLFGPRVQDPAPIPADRVDDSIVFPENPVLQAKLAALPDVPALLEMLRSAPPAPTVEETVTKVAASTGKAAATFLFLADPQPNRADGRDDNNKRVQNLSNLNLALNQLETSNWPSAYKLSRAGQPIGPIDGIFFGGDLCQTGGDYSFIDQASRYPPIYKGGWELQMMRWLFQNDFVPDLTFESKTTRTKYTNLYWGLGNHDVQSDYHPPVRWYQGCFEWATSSDDYWRYQMWNFICQMNIGYQAGNYCNLTTSELPRTSVTGADAPGTGFGFGFEWKAENNGHSFNYYVDLGPVDVFQLHTYGGDDYYGRASGIDWLKQQLAQRGTNRPIIIVQHYTFQNKQPFVWPTPGKQDALLDILAPYNVVALLTGHVHNPLSSVPSWALRENNAQTEIQEFRPGSCGDYGYFALVRVSDTDFDIVEGDGSSGTVQWRNGYNKSISAWGLFDLSGATHAPKIAPPLAGYAGEFSGGFEAVITLADDADRHIHELGFAPWVRQSYWVDTDLTQVADAPLAAAGTSLVAFFAEPWHTKEVMYLDNSGHVQELTSGYTNTPWKCYDLTALSGAPSANGTLLAGFNFYSPYLSTKQVAYLGGDGHIHELCFYQGRGWVPTDLNVSAGVSDRQVTVTALTGCSWFYGLSKQFVFMDENGMIFEFAKTWDQQSWTYENVTNSLQAPFAAGTQLAVYIAVDGSKRIIFVGQDNHIYQMLNKNHIWTAYEDITNAGAAPVVNIEALTAYVSNERSKNNVVFLDAVGEVHELSSSDGIYWDYQNVTQSSGAPNAVGSTLTAYNWDTGRRKRIVYLDNQGLVQSAFIQNPTAV